MTTVYLRNVGSKEDECWVPCAKGDKGAIAFCPNAPAPKSPKRVKYGRGRGEDAYLKDEELQAKYRTTAVFWKT